jgi:hypothetical protein
MTGRWRMDRYDVQCGLAMLMASTGVVLNVQLLQAMGDDLAGWLVTGAVALGVAIPLAVLVRCIMRKAQGTAVVTAVWLGSTAYAALSVAYVVTLLGQRF